MIKYYFLFFFLVTNSFLWAQSPNFKNYTVEDNLPSSECYQVLQDKKGFIWIASDKGVARFDGYKFQNFTKEDGLPENSIIRMYEDPYGKIWFAGVTGKIAYYKNNKITSLKINNELAAKIKGGFVCSMGYSDHALYLGMYYGPGSFRILFHQNKEKLIMTPIDNKNLGGFVRRLKNGEFIQGWIGRAYKSMDFHHLQNGESFTTKNAFSIPAIASNNVRFTLLQNK